MSLPSKGETVPSCEWELLQELDELTPEELEAQIAAEEAALLAEQQADALLHQEGPQDTLGAIHSATTVSLTVDEAVAIAEHELGDLALGSALSRLRDKKTALEANNNKIAAALASGRDEALLEVDSRTRHVASREAALAAARARNAAKAAHLGSKTASLTASIRRDEQRLAFKERGVDICIMMDCTSSMTSHVAACKTKVLEIMDLAHTLHPDAITRLSFVGYRDFDKESLSGGWEDGHIKIVDFCDKANTGRLRSVVNGITALGGGDGPEDVAGALKAVTELSWESSTRLLIHFGDAPCHGEQYHAAEYARYGDTYPAGNPDGLTPEDQLKIMCTNRIDYHFARIGGYTDAMIAVFNNVYALAPGDAAFAVHEYGETAANFLPTVLNSISSSMRRSFRRSSSASSGTSPGIALPEVYNMLD